MALAIRFVQIAAIASELTEQEREMGCTNARLFALDAEGTVYSYSFESQSWTPLAHPMIELGDVDAVKA